MTSERIIPAPGHYIIRNPANGRVSYWQGEYHQSAADSHGVSTADYIHAMYYFLMQVQARDVLMIGCGGGTLATMLHRSGAKVTVVDLNAFCFDIAHDYFHLPRGVACHVGDGVAYLKAHRHRHDAIVLDAFGDGGMPDAFLEPDFFKLAQSRMTEDGLFLINVIVDNDEDRRPDRLVRTLRTWWPRTRLLDTHGWTDRNAVVAAGAVAGLKKPVVLMPPRPGGARLARELEILNWRPVRR